MPLYTSNTNICAVCSDGRVVCVGGEVPSGGIIRYLRVERTSNDNIDININALELYNDNKRLVALSGIVYPGPWDVTYDWDKLNDGDDFTVANTVVAKDVYMESVLGVYSTTGFFL